MRIYIHRYTDISGSLFPRIQNSDDSPFISRSESGHNTECWILLLDADAYQFHRFAEFQRHSRSTPHLNFLGETSNTLHRP